MVLTVIQCASGKDPSAGYFRSRSGRRVHFVAHPDEAPPRDGIVYARPDDQRDEGANTWRDQVVSYNTRGNENPWNLYPAWRLYRPKAYPAAYSDLVGALGVERIFVLSAGWGLIRADFLTPYYDITFSGKAERYKRRFQSETYRGLCQLPLPAAEPILFFGGRDYLPLFEQLTVHIDSPLVVFHRAEYAKRSPRFTYVKYDTRASTNWHYLCVRDFLSGRLSLPKGVEV